MYKLGREGERQKMEQKNGSNNLMNLMKIPLLLGSTYPMIVKAGKKFEIQHCCCSLKSESNTQKGELFYYPCP